MLPSEHATSLETKRADVELSDVEHALDALEAEGARRFDAACCDCIHTLLTRAENLPDRTRTLLIQRASEHVERLRVRFERARHEASQHLSQAEHAHGPEPQLQQALERGEVSEVRRSLRKLARAPRTHLPAHHEETRRPGVLAYDDSLADLVASMALARAIDVVPEDAGPYNPLRIASELLARMRTVSPIYLTAQLNRLEELASLLSLPELPEDAPRKAVRKRRALKRSS